MHFQKQQTNPTVAVDMTPMIDMTFQLVTFFMMAINFTSGERDECVRLPLSELAKPPEVALESPITIQLTREGVALFAGEELHVSGLRSPLLREYQVLKATPGRTPANATIIIRADRETETGLVQEVMKLCQEIGFEKFVLRAMQERT